jgi:hypothetical protein
MQVGDFSILPDGQDYYDASLEFVNEAGMKIKQLAEMLEPRNSGKAGRA